MIPFEEIDARLTAIEKDRKWLAEITGRSEGSIRSALAPNSPPKNRTGLLQKALTDAIEKEEARQRESHSQPFVAPAPIVLPDRVTIECLPEERRNWERAARKKKQGMDDWIVTSLNHCADLGLEIAKESPIPFPKPQPKIMAAAGSPIGAEVMDWNGPSSTILVRICGLSMLPLLDDGDEVAMHSRDVSRSPFMRKGLIYLLHYDGGWMVKRYNTRDPREEELGSDFLTPGGKVPVLESLNPDYPEIPIRGDLNWMAWLDPAEIKK